jgi:hypothetical protein
VAYRENTVLRSMNLHAKGEEIGNHEKDGQPASGVGTRIVNPLFLGDRTHVEVKRARFGTCRTVTSAKATTVNRHAVVTVRSDTTPHHGRTRLAFRTNRLDDRFRRDAGQVKRKSSTEQVKTSTR